MPAHQPRAKDRIQRCTEGLVGNIKEGSIYLMDVISKQKKTFIKYAVIIFLILSVFTLSIISYVQYKLNESKRNEILNRNQILLETENTIIATRFSRVSGDLLYVADCFRLNDNGDGDYSEVEKQWVAFANRKTIYDHIRFIDIEGNEIVRVNYYDNGSVIVDKDDLQNKKDSFYFADILQI